MTAFSTKNGKLFMHIIGHSFPQQQRLVDFNPPIILGVNLTPFNV